MQEDVAVSCVSSKRNPLNEGFYYLQWIILLQLSVAYALQRDSQFKRERGKKRNKNLPDDKVSRCRVTLNQQLMSEHSKPHTQSSNNLRALVPT